MGAGEFEGNLVVDVSGEAEDTLSFFLPPGLVRLLDEVLGLAGDYRLRAVKLGCHLYEEYSARLEPGALERAVLLLRRLEYLDGEDSGFYIHVGGHYSLVAERDGLQLNIRVAVNMCQERGDEWSEFLDEEGAN